MNTEKRKYPRSALPDVTVEVYSRFEKTSEIVEICHVVDVSENGLRFRTTAAYEPRQTVRLTFPLPDSHISIRTKSEIIHVTATKDYKQVGVQFKDLGLAESKLLKTFVQKTLGL